jgi:hypothetical protein
MSTKNSAPQDRCLRNAHVLVGGLFPALTKAVFYLLYFPSSMKSKKNIELS